MALEAGELFASFHVDISGVDRELEGIEKRFERLGQDSAGSLGTGLQLGAALARAGVSAAMVALGNAGAAAAGRALSASVGAGIGRAFGQGLAQGIRNAQGEAGAAAGSLGQAAAGALRQALDSHSPSRVTRDIGQDFDLGLTLGLQRGANGVHRAAGELGELAAEALRQSLPRTAESGGAGMESRTVRQVIDGAAVAGVAAVPNAGWAEDAARMIAAALNGVSVRMDGEQVGALVAPTVSERIARQANWRRNGTV